MRVFVLNVFEVTSVTVNDDCGDGKIDVVNPYVPEQVKAIPAIVISSPTLKPCGLNVVTLVTPVLPSYSTFIMVPIPD